MTKAEIHFNLFELTLRPALTENDHSSCFHLTCYVEKITITSHKIKFFPEKVRFFLQFCDESILREISRVFQRVAI